MGDTKPIKVMTRSGFADPVAAEQAHGLAEFELQADVVDDDTSRVTGRKVLNLQEHRVV